jgi:hypothetical protein
MVEDLLWAVEIDVFVTEHFTTHISAKHHHLTGAPKLPAPLYTLSFRTLTGH